MTKITTKFTDFSNIPIDFTWSFSDKTSKDTSYLTHGYYTSPAKFIPQLAARLILENSQEGDVVVDPLWEAAQLFWKQS
ncbi:MAG: site-specific DNA-methyltransferase [Leptospiraceae bacterium]|nr:site-specific DNA-methyltransferase [Leptospiraceae bacterium]